MECYVRTRFSKQNKVTGPGKGKKTLLYNHSVQEAALHIGDTSIKPMTRDLYFICCKELWINQKIHKGFIGKINNTYEHYSALCQ